MKRSTDRILTTHMGSLPRPDLLADLLVAEAEGRPVDSARIPALTDEAMDLIVRRQQVGQKVRSRQAAHVRRQDAIRAVFHAVCLPSHFSTV